MGGFSRRINPVARIREQIDVSEKVERLGMSIRLEFKNEELEDLAIFAKCYVFSGQRLNEFVDEIVKTTYEETFNLLKRRMSVEEERWSEDKN